MLMFPLITTAGGGITVMVIVPFAGAMHAGVPDVATPTNVYVVVLVNADVIDALPEPSSTMFWVPGVPVTV